MQYQTRLASTDFKLQDIDLISHVLSYGTLPQKFEATVEVLRLQQNTNWSALTQILINKEVQMNTLSENHTDTAAAMISDSKSQKNQGKGRNRKKQKRSKKRSQNQEDSDDSDLDSNQKSGSKAKEKDNSMQCYYCCKRGHKATECRLREQAKKIRKENRKTGPKDDTSANAAIATAEPVKEATIADAEI
jgi:hypothetical protein